MKLCENIGINSAGHLTFAGVDTVELANKHQTPLYLMDEDRIRHNCRIYMDAMKEAFGEGSMPLYASKAACFKRIYEIMKEEGMSIDLVSSGEIFTAVKAGFPMERSFFHGNNKTDWDISYAMDCGVGHFVADSVFELRAINQLAAQRGIRQKVLLRLTPGIDPHTYEAISTGKVDSKFGAAIETGQAAAFVEEALALPNLEVMGYHCHVGSQVFDEEGNVYLDAADIMMEFAAQMYRKHGLQAKMLNMGGGYGVRYTENDPYMDIPGNIRGLADHIRALYTVGTIKEIPGYKNYVSVDGGMTDNPRFALYGAPYTVYLANRMNEEPLFPCSLVGCCCESGDIIQPNVQIPKPDRGDIAAVCTTGAYNYSMASNYNRIPRPPIVMLHEGEDYVAVKRESFEDLTANDI